jgi:conjugal transfer pilus assembly protein TraE
MNKQSLIERLALAADIKAFVFWVLGISVALNFILVAAVYTLPKGVKHELVPPQVTKTFWVGADQFDRSHLEEMGLYVVQLQLNVTPKSAKFQGQQLLKIVAPAEYATLSEQIHMNAALIERLNVATTFMPTSFSYDPKFPNRISVQGVFQTHFPDKTIGSTTKVYMVEFSRSAAGKMELKDFRETKTNDPLGVEEDFKAAQAVKDKDGAK